MVSLPTDNDRQLWSIRLFGISKGRECFDDLWQLFPNDCIELSLRDTVAVDNDSTWRRFLVFMIEPQTFFHYGLQIGYHLMAYEPRSILNSRERLTSFFDSWILRLAGNCAKFSSMVATTAAIDGVPLVEPGPG